MANEFDPYREALVMETATVWPDAYDDWDRVARREIEARLHTTPRDAAELTYVRTYTGFCRQITVTPDDLERLGVTVA